MIGEAHRRLDALIEEERTRSADAGRRRTAAEVYDTRRGPPTSFRPPTARPSEEATREQESEMEVVPSSLKSVKPGENAAAPPTLTGPAVA